MDAINNNPGFLHLCELGSSTPLDGSEADVFPGTGSPRWLHMRIEEEETARFLREQVGLNNLVVEAMVAEDTRSRLRVVDDGIMILLKAMHVQQDKANPEDMISLRIWLDENKIITAREHDIDPILELRHRISQSRGPEDTGTFLVDMLELHFQEISPYMEELEDSIGQAEELIAARRLDELCPSIAQMQLRTAGFLRHLTPQRAVLERLINHNIAFINEHCQERLSENLDHLLRILELLHDARERTNILNDQVNRIRDAQLNKTSFVFTLAATIFLPLGFLTGLFGVNLMGIPMANHPLGFVALVALCVFVAVFLVILFRWRKFL